jgi:hypothetical protein
MSAAADPPVLSIVVALIAGDRGALQRCLRALHAQQDPPSCEILVPYDDPCAALRELGDEFPAVRFLYAEGLDSTAARAGGSREHHDTLRTVGLRAARGRYVALTEDHAVAEPGWCRGLVALLEQHPKVAAIGGAVECGSDRWLHRAIYYCDFGRYQGPLPEGPAEFVSDSNVIYRRTALEEIGDAWAADYHETLVHFQINPTSYTSIYLTLIRNLS